VAGAICHPCAQGKLTRAPHTASATTVPRMTLIHSDTSGPFTPSLGGALHFVTLLDDKTKLLLAIPIAAKSHVGAVLRAKIPMLERLCGDKVKRIRFDGAKEYVSSPTEEKVGRGHKKKRLSSGTEAAPLDPSEGARLV